LQHEWSIEPTFIQQGVQFGNNQQPLSITVFDTGTVFIQGKLALSYSLQNMARLLSHSSPKPIYHREKPVMSAVTFEIYQPSINNSILSEATHDDIMTPTILEEGNTSNHQFQSQPIKNGTQHEPSLNRAPPQHEPSLNTVPLLIQKLKEKLLTMESVHQKSQREMEKCNKELGKENKELRHTVGPKISYLLQKPYQQTQDSPTHNPTTSTQSTTANKAAEHQDKHGNEEEWTTVTRDKYQKMKTPSSTTGPSTAGK